MEKLKLNYSNDIPLPNNFLVEQAVLNILLTNPNLINNENIQKDIEDKFGYNLYRDVGDLYGKSNSQREFYTMPSTTIPNNQTSFAKWCYSVGPTCKEKSIYCTPESDPVPYIDTMNPNLLNDVKY